MPQVSLYLDAQTARGMERTARAAGMSRSRWVAALVRARLASEWPPAVERLAGAWKDLPSARSLRRTLGSDLPREPF